MSVQEPQSANVKRGTPRWLWMAGGMAMILALGYLLYDRFATRSRGDLQGSTDSHVLAVPSEQLNFGTAWEQPQFPWTLTIRNTSSRRVDIEYFSKTCTCAVIEPKSLTLEAGESRDLHLTINLKRTRIPESAESPFAIEIVPFERLETGPARALNSFQVEGRVRYAIQYLSVPELGTHSEDAQPLPAVRLGLQSLLRLANLAVASTDSRFKVKVDGAIDPGHSFALVVSPNERLPVGPIQFDVTITPELPGGERAPALVVPVRGRIVGDIQASPLSVIFGSRPVGESLEETITLTSLTGQEFTVEKWDAQLPGLSVERATELANTFQIRQRVLAAGQQSGNILFVISKRGKKGTVSIPVHYHGLE